MNKKVKSVSMLLFLASLSTGIAYADQPKEKSEIDIVQQATACQGISCWIWRKAKTFNNDNLYF